MRASFFSRFLIPLMALGLSACGSGGETSGEGNPGGSGGSGTTPGGGAGASGGSTIVASSGEGGVGGSGGAGTTPGGGAGASGGSTTATSASGPYGVFEIHYVTGAAATASFTDISGLMRDGTPTELVVWAKKKTEGDCSLYTPRAPFCESCVAPQVCVADNVCRTPPSSYPVGKVTLTGLNPTSGASPLELTPITTDSATNYLCAETLPMPPCTAGGAVRLDAAGAGPFPAFSVAGQCIAPLVVGNASIAIESGKDFTLTWTPGIVADARIGLLFDLSHHGGSKGQIICETADSGSLKVSGALIKSLMDLGVTGFPKAEINRIFTGKTTVGTGTAELRLRSDLVFQVDIPGLKSCNTNSDCTAPETCQVPGQMCGISCTTSADCPSGKTCFASTKTCK
jgi:hypothetical protein